MYWGQPQAVPPCSSPVQLEKPFPALKSSKMKSLAGFFFLRVCPQTWTGYQKYSSRGEAESLWGSRAPSAPEWEYMKRLGWGRGPACLTLTSVAELCRHSLSRETHFFPNAALAAQQSDNNQSITVTNLYEENPIYIMSVNIYIISISSWVGSIDFVLCRGFRNPVFILPSLSCRAVVFFFSWLVLPLFSWATMQVIQIAKNQNIWHSIQSHHKTCDRTLC